MNEAVDRREFVIALVGPVGSGMPLVTRGIERELARFGYATEVIKVSEAFRKLDGDYWKSLPGRSEMPADDRYKAFMDAGDRLRRSMDRKDAAMYPAIRALRQRRKKHSGFLREPASDVVYVIDSLKTPEELQLLLRIYGSRFCSIAAHSPRAARLDTLAKDIAGSRHVHKSESFHHKAEEILYRDERGTESDLYGQNVADTFPLVDFVVPSSSPDLLDKALNRWIDLLFGRQFITPTRDEFGMYVAHASSLLSAAMGRQVGACVLTADGSVVTTGTNEVPKPGGGHYWEEDNQSGIDDGRDFQRGDDTSERMHINLLGNTLDRLLAAGWRAPERRARADDASPTNNEEQRRRDVNRELARLRTDPKLAHLRRSLLIEDVIEFYREAHAETAALLEASRRTTSLQGCVLYATTFPCHECARHIVASGIRRVVFLQPYAKSLVTDSYSDSIALDPTASGGLVEFQTFVGVTPRQYGLLFQMGARKDGDGRAVVFDESVASPRLGLTGPNDAIENRMRTANLKAVVEREVAAHLDLKSHFDRSNKKGRPKQR